MPRKFSVVAWIWQEQCITFGRRGGRVSRGQNRNVSAVQATFVTRYNSAELHRVRARLWVGACTKAHGPNIYRPTKRVYACLYNVHIRIEEHVQIYARKHGWPSSREATRLSRWRRFSPGRGWVITFNFREDNWRWERMRPSSTKDIRRKSRLGWKIGYRVRTKKEEGKIRTQDVTSKDQDFDGEARWSLTRLLRPSQILTQPVLRSLSLESR